MNTDVHFSSATDDWATPQDLFDELNEEFGPFELDVCADFHNRKCDYYFSKENDGLKQDWSVRKRIWMNCPYGRGIIDWVRKAYEASCDGATVVCLLPARTDTRWFHDFIWDRETNAPYTHPRTQVRFLKGRVKFGGHKNSAPFPSMIVVFGGL